MATVKYTVPDPKLNAEEGPHFLGVPERWLDKPHYRCGNGHVSTLVIKSEERGDRCPACCESVRLTFPEDHDDVTEDDASARCPRCGSEMTFGYGLAFGGEPGGYEMCVSCDYFVKGGSTEHGEVSCLDQAK